MVRIIEKTLEERTQEERQKMLIDVAKKVFRLGEGRLGLADPIIEYGILGFGVKCCYEHYIGLVSVCPLENKVTVADKRHFDQALKLAEAYEKATGEEFTLKKEY